MAFSDGEGDDRSEASREEEEEDEEDGPDLAELEGEIDEMDDNDDPEAYTLDPRECTGAGIIKQIKCDNFMCHRALTVDFDKGINFIYGPNGSGKSAIVAAIQMCFGGKAKNTHRFKKADDLIRRGWSGHAKVEITVINNPDGYQYSKYGDAITVRRIIKKGGGGSVELLASDGTTIAKGTDELTKFMDELNLQVDNPVAVLDQPSAKTFLQGSDKDKYKFFMKAADLEKVHQTLAEIKEEMAIHSSKAEKEQRNANTLKLEVERLQGLLKECEVMAGHQDKVKSLTKQKIWAVVQQISEELESKEKGLQQAQDEYAEAAGRSDREVEALERECTITQDNAQALGQNFHYLETILNEKKQAFRLATRAHVEKQSEVEELQSRVNSHDTEIANLKRDRMDKINESNKLAHSAEEQRINAGLEEVDREIASTDQELKRVKEEDDKCLQDLENCTDILANLKDQIQDAKGRYDQAKGYLENLQRSNDPISKFGREMQDLVQMIHQRQGQFKSAPIGPLGAYVTIKEGVSEQLQWCVEEYLSNAVSSFLVVDHRDKKTLQDMISHIWSRSRNRQPSIIVTARSNRRHSTPEFRDAMQISSVIAVNDDQVYNALVDQISIENILLATSQAEAFEKFLQGAPGNQKLMHNARYVYYPSGVDRLVSRMQCRRGNVSEDMNRGKTLRSVLSSDLTMQRNHAQEQSQIAAEDYEAARSPHERAENHMKELRVQKASCEQQLKSLLTLKKDLTKKKHKLNAELPQTQVAEEVGGADFLLELIEEEEQSLAESQKALAVAQSDLVHVAEDVAVAKRQSTEASNAVTRAKQEARVIESELSKYLKKIDEAKKLMAQQNRTVEDLAYTRATMYADVQRTQEKLLSAKEYATSQVQALCEEDRQTWDGSTDCGGKSPEELSKLIAYHENEYTRLDSLRRENNELPHERLLDEYEAANSKFNAMQNFTRECQAQTEKLHISLHARLQKWKAFRRFMERNSTNLFNQFLQKKGATGRIIFDKDRKELKLEVQNNECDDASKTSDVKMLSGGERSFATLSLLLALGSNHDCPFRLMDEFDVFMDATNRNLAIKQVIQFAREYSQKQFIFVTPQDVSQIKQADNVKILKFDAIARNVEGQSTLTEAGFTRG